MRELLELQRLAGNAAVAAALQRQGGGGAGGSAGVQPGRFVNTGTSRLGRTLGFHQVGPYAMNGVEFVFPLDAGARPRYADLRPRQWSGPEALYFKTGEVFGSPWREAARGPGSGADEPEPESQRVDDRAVVYADSPGPSLGGHLRHTWVHAVQNFTGWVEGTKRSGGGPQRLAEVVAWHSVVSVVNTGVVGGGPPAFTPNALTRTGTGWVSLDPPAI